MFTVYILQDSSGRLYKGVTGNIERRLKEHRSGQTKTTAKMVGVNVVYREEFETFSDAREREVYFKTAAGRRYLKTVFKKGP